jgi:hypothetical protein
MGRWVVFGEVVGTVEFAGRPIEVELSLRHAVLEPVVAHVEGLGSFHANRCMEDAVSSGIVGLNGRPPRFRLCVTHLLAEAATVRSVLQRT